MCNWNNKELNAISMAVSQEEFKRIPCRGGFGLDGSGIGQNRCPSVENKFTNNPSVNRPLICLGRLGQLSGFGGWMSGRWLGLIGPASGL